MIMVLKIVKNHTGDRDELLLSCYQTLTQTWPKKGPEIPFGLFVLCLARSEHAANIC